MLAKLSNIFTGVTLVALAAFMALTGCITDGPPKPPPPRWETGEVTLKLNLPGRFQSAGRNKPPRTEQTRALTEVDENAVDVLHVLTFDDTRQLVDIVEARSKGNDEYSVPLPELNPGTPVTMVALANSRDILAGSIGLSANNVSPKDYASVMQSITAAVDGKLFFDAGDNRLPMWGETRQFNTPTDPQAPSLNEGVTLMRSVARIDVGVGNLTKDGDMPVSWDGNNRDGDPIPFVLKSVYVMRPPDRFGVAPLPANVNPTGGKNGGPAAIAPSVPSSSSPYGLGASVADLGYQADGSTPFSIMSTIYVPEADIASGGSSRHQQRMALVIGGVFGDDPNGPETYYRVDFSDGTLRDVLRNTLYTFSIKDVTSGGEESVEEAYGAQSMNMTVDVEEWNMGYNYNIWFEGSHYFAMSHRDVRFGPMPGGEPVRVDILTNIDAADGGFGFYTTDNTPTASFGSGGPLTFQDADDSYEYTLEKNTEPGTSDDAYILWITNPRHNIDPNTNNAREDVWTIKTLNLRMRFTVSQEYVPGGIISVNGRRLGNGDREGSFLPPEGNDGNPISIEIVRLDPLDLTATDADTGNPVSWIDLGNTGGLQTAGVGGVYGYHRDITVGPFPYDPANPGATQRVAVISAYNAATNTNVNYTVTQQAPHIVADRTTVPVSIPQGGPDEIVVPVYVSSNVQPGHLAVSKLAGGDGAINLVDPHGTLTGYDPRNSGRLMFEVTVTRKSGDAYSAVFRVATTDAVYGPLPAVDVSVIVPPANQIFVPAWSGVSFPGGAGSWTPVAPEWSAGKRYVFPWNTTGVSFRIESNVLAEPDTAIMSTADQGWLVAGTPAPTGNGTVIYPYTFDTGAAKSSYNSISRHTVAFNSAVPPFIESGRADFAVGVQVFRMAAGAHQPANTNFDWNGRAQASPATIGIVDNVEWTASSSGSWLRLRDKDAGGAFAQSVTIDDCAYAPVEDPGDNYAANTTTMLVNDSQLEFVIDPLDFYDPFVASQPESRTATITVTNNDHDASKSGAADPAPVTITQWNRVLRSETLTEREGGMPMSGTVLKPEHLEVGTTFSFAARTNMNTWRVDFWDANADGTKLGTVPLNPNPIIWGGTPALSASSAPIVVKMDNVSLPAQDKKKRNLLVTLSAQNLTEAQEQVVGLWTQPGSYPHDITGLSGNPYLAPPGVLGVDVVTGNLTLRGSKEYAGTIYDVDLGLGGLSPNTVIVALFKRGSLIGLKAQTGGFDAGVSGTVIWAPFGYDLTNNRPATWNAIPYVTGEYPTTNNVAALTGDPCKFADGHDEEGTGTWMTPTGSATGGSNGLGYWNGPNGVAYNGNQNYNSAGMTGRQLLPNTVVTGLANGLIGWTYNTSTPANSLIFPYVGSRSATGEFTYTGTQSAGGWIAETDGAYFWINGGTGNSGIRMWGNTSFSVTNLGAGVAAAIRCVPPYIQ